MSYNINSNGYYGSFGGAYIPEMLLHNIEELKDNYLKIINVSVFKNLNLGIDPTLFTSRQIKNFFLRNNKITMIKENLVD